MFEKLKEIMGAPEELARLEGDLEDLREALQSIKLSMDSFKRDQEDLKSRIFGLGKNFAELKTVVEGSDAEAEAPEVEAITLKGRAFEFFIQQLELSGRSNELLKAQRRYINRLLRLLRTTVEDPGKSITEELRKAEKWNKVLKKRHKEWKEDYIGNR